jgi:selenocysteine lyase/cysteine desulfurase
MSLVHFNHSGAGRPAPETLQTITDYLRSEAEVGPMEASQLVGLQRAEIYEVAARLLGCGPQHVAFGSGHGQLYGDIISAIPLKGEDRVLVSRQEWMGNVICLQNAARLSGASLSLMASDDSTAVDVEELCANLSPDVRILALTWIGASGALINPAAAIGRAIRQSRSSAFFIIDASQAIGQLPINVEELGCDALVACGRKFLRGPRGTAIAYISPRLAAEVVPRKLDNFSAAWNGKDVVQVSDARVFETAEESVALRLGLGKAIEQALELGLDNIREKLNHKASALRDALAAQPKVQVLDLGKEKAACVTFTVGGLSCGQVKRALADRGITIGMNGSGYTPYDLELRGITELLRASVHMSTSDEDIETLVGAIAELTGTRGGLVN